MIKKIILILMISIIIIMLIDIIIFATKHTIYTIKDNMLCSGHIQMTCGECGCENICYPVTNTKSAL